MASGVAICPEVLKIFDEMKMHYQGEDEMERYKFAMFCISDDEKQIVFNSDCSLKIKHLQNEKNVFKKIVSMIPHDDCCYALYDCHYETKDYPKKQDLVFIMSAPETAPVKKKMIYASSKAAFKATVKGYKIDWQINDVSDREMSALTQKLSQVVSLEGIKV